MIPIVVATETSAEAEEDLDHVLAQPAPAARSRTAGCGRAPSRVATVLGAASLP